MPTWSQSVVELAESVRTGEAKAIDVLEGCLARIDRADAELNAFAHRDDAGARARAADVDRMVGEGIDPGPLAGVPFGVKSLEPVAGWPHTKASLVFRDRVAAWDSTQVARLKEAGAVPVGLTTAPEFGSIAYTRSHLQGVTTNPWDLTRTPGGSSGGSAAAVAAGLVPFCTGGDGGGSIRIPCSYSGLFGLKPSWGRISHGPFDTSSDLTAVYGPMTTTVRDAARYLDCVVGVDPYDRWAIPAPPFSYEEALSSTPLMGLRVAWSDTLGFGRSDPEVARMARDAAMALVDGAGFTLVDRDVSLPDAGISWGILGAQDLARTLAPYWPACADQLTPAVRAAVEASDLLNYRRYARAIGTRVALDHALSDLFDDVDLVLTPSTPTVAFGAKGPMPSEIAGEPVVGLGAVCFTFPFNLGGQPGATCPAGLTAEGLPVGLQIVGRVHDDRVVLAAAAAFEKARPWPRFAPYAEAL